MYDEHNKENKAQNSKPNGDQNANEAYHWNTPRRKAAHTAAAPAHGKLFPRATRSSSPPPEPQSTQRPLCPGRAGTYSGAQNPLYEREHKRFGSGFHGGGSGHSGSGSGAKKNGAGKIIALALVCALGGGLVGGVAGSAAGNSFLRPSTTVQVSNRTVNEVKEMKVDGKTEMTNL